MTPALALEQVMLHPDYHQLVEHLRAHAPAGLVDQADAAADDALQLMAAAARHAGADHIRAAAPADIPDWVRLPLLDTVTAWAAGQAATCRHQPTPGRPQPVLAAAWRPRLVVCAACTHLTALAPGSDPDRTCDRCGRICAGVEHGDGIHPGIVQLGPLVYQYGTCGDCQPHPGPPSATHTPEQQHPGGTGRGRPRGGRGRGRGRGTRQGRKNR
ncbi:hypothetical protein ACN28G_19710 [Micromonospora sp. WMMA1923]|uniref:hypothetical protein n=1 Tax=Micromonospora sp. WMMA1923 TaxID=3404125 RepID=UPI003B94DD6D